MIPNSTISTVDTIRNSSNSYRIGHNTKSEMRCSVANDTPYKKAQPNNTQWNSLSLQERECSKGSFSLNRSNCLEDKFSAKPANASHINLEVSTKVLIMTFLTIASVS